MKEKKVQKNIKFQPNAKYYVKKIEAQAKKWFSYKKKRVFAHAYSKPCQKSEMEPLADIVNA